MTTPAPEDVARLRSAFESHYDALLGYAIRRTSSREDAEEIVASTFATAWRRIRDLPPEPLTLTWLYRVAWRMLANHYRSTSRRTRLFGRLSGQRASEVTEPAADDGLLQQALGALRSSEREVLRLVAWEQLSYLEAAAVLNCSPNAFAIRLHRARVSLRREVERLTELREQAERSEQGTWGGNG